MLPYQEDDKQRVERKRHIGNDVVVVVFNETGRYHFYFDSVFVEISSILCDRPFNPSVLTSHFIHVVCVVSPALPGELPAVAPVVEMVNDHHC
jgi:hypothetical protein